MTQEYINVSEAMMDVLVVLDVWFPSNDFIILLFYYILAAIKYELSSQSF